GARAPEVKLDAGELWLRVQPGKGGVKVRTPAGVMSAEATECFVAVRPAERSGQGAEVRVAVRDGKVRLTNGQGEALARSGVVLPGGGEHELAATYRRLQTLEVPVVITADTLLHLTRGQLDQTLRSLEERVLLPDLSALTEALLHTIDRTPPPANREDWRAAR